MGMKIFLFDIGNVICDFDYETLLKRYEEISGKPVGIHSSFDQEIYNAVEAGEISDQEYVDKVNQAKSINWSVEDLIYAWQNIFSENIYGRALFNHSTKNGTLTYTLSNIAEYHIKAINRSWPNYLDRATGFFMSYKMGVRKPDARIYLDAIDQLEANPNDCFFIDDLEENVLAARDIGIQAYQFIPDNHEYIFNKANEFFDWKSTCDLPS